MPTSVPAEVDNLMVDCVSTTDTVNNDDKQLRIRVHSRFVWVLARLGLWHVVKATFYGEGYAPINYEYYDKYAHKTWLLR